ncbi:MAG: MoxR family ATPase [bacterium]
MTNSSQHMPPPSSTISKEIEALGQECEKYQAVIQTVFDEVKRILVGQDDMLLKLIIGLLARGHILLEGVPGLAKTLSINSLARAIGAKFSRIQFTPDLLPADIVGTRIYDPRTSEFSIRLGPIFANLVLADEINRAPAKVQSALLEAMQEKQVTIGDKTFKLPDPFLVMATQNPIETEGTYPLPEAQLDRFMLKVKVSYPWRKEEGLIIDRITSGKQIDLNAVITPEKILEMQKVVDRIYVDENIKKYVLDLVFATRQPKEFGLDLDYLIEYGASPRASIYLVMTAKAFAFLNGRGFVSPDDVKAMAPDVLRHRILLTYEAEAEEVTSEEIIRKILSAVYVP